MSMACRALSKFSKASAVVQKEDCNERMKVVETASKCE